METVYKYRQLWGIAEYNIIEGEFGDSTLHLQDTTCDHYGPKCEIEVMKCDDGDCYQFSKPLNSSAENYSYFHKVEKFWATKEEAYIDAIRVNIKNCKQYIAGDERRLSETQEKLAGISGGDVHYLTASTAKLGINCFVDHEGSCRIIGTINFDDGTTGYLTDNNYGEDRWDSYEGDRIILKEKDNTGRIITERGDVVYLSKVDFDNNENNDTIAKLNKIVNSYQKGIERSTARLNILQDAFNKRDTLTIDELIAIANS
jgi:uncharacterized coiled-coil protein SlyX